MASGDTLLIFTPQCAEIPASNGAAQAARNGHPVLAFDDTTAEAAIFSAVLPRTYDGGGITVYVHWSAKTATSGTVGWTVEIERIGSAQDMDSDSFATAQTITAATTSGTSGVVTITNVAITDGANMDSVTAGEGLRIRIKRDVANDNATGDAELRFVEVKET